MGVDSKILIKHSGNQITESELLSNSRYICELFGANRFCIDRLYGGDSHALEFVEEFYQDGPSIEPAHGEHSLNAMLGLGSTERVMQEATGAFSGTFSWLSNGGFLETKSGMVGIHLESSRRK